MTSPTPADLVAELRAEADVVGRTTAWRLLLKAADTIERLTSSREQVTEFAREILLNRFGNWDGGDLQDLGVKHGLLVPIEATEPCGEACVCVEYDDFPQTCYRFGPALHGDA